MFGACNQDSGQWQAALVKNGSADLWGCLRRFLSVAGANDGDGSGSEISLDEDGLDELDAKAGRPLGPVSDDDEVDDVQNTVHKQQDAGLLFLFGG